MKRMRIEKHYYFKKKKFIFPFIFLLMAFQCSGNLAFTNSYEHDVVVYTVYDNDTNTIERCDNFYPETVLFVASNGHIEYSNITEAVHDLQELLKRE
jgi:hypothetical protein